VPQPGIGTGRAGVLPAPLPLSELAEKVKGLLGAPAVWVSGGEDVIVKRLAVCAGAGGDFAGDALASGADAFLTGEIKHHDLIDISREHFPIIAAGHYDTEAPAMALLAVRLREDMRAAGYEAGVIVSSEMSAPARMI
jgi:putative NIF3 family GTP cyclohydrolase 1 type 2